MQSDDNARMDYEMKMSMPLPWEGIDQITSDEDDLALFKQALGIGG